MPLIISTAGGAQAFDTDACSVTDSGALIVYSPTEPRNVIAGFAPNLWQTFHFESADEVS